MANPLIKLAMGMPRRAASRKLYALSNFSAANFYATPNGGGEAGVETGFGIAQFVQVTSLAGQQFVADSGLVAQPYAGYQHFVGGSNDVTGNVATSTTTVSGTPALRKLLSSDLNRLFLLVLVYAPGVGVLSYVDRAAGAAGAAAAYLPSVGVPHFWGVQSAAGGSPCVGIRALAQLAFRGVPSDAQIKELYDIVRAKGDLPTPVEWPYGSSHRWNLKEALAGQYVVNGQLAPAVLEDTVTGATVDRMGRQGSPTIAVIDTKADGRKTYGAIGFSASAYLQSSIAFTTGPTVDVTFVATIFSAPAAVKFLVNHVNSAAQFGFAVYTTTNELVVYSYAPNAKALSYAITSGDLGVRYTWRVVYTGSVWRLYKDGVKQGGDAAIGYTHISPGNVPLLLGISHTRANPGDNVSIFRVTIPGAHDWDITADVKSNGGPTNGLPAQVKDRIGTDHLTRVGGLFVRGTGLTGFTGSFPQTLAGSGIAGVATGWWAGCLVSQDAFINVPRDVFGRSNVSNSGWYFEIANSAGGRMTMRIADGGGVYQTVSTGITMAIGRAYDFRVVHDGSTATGYVDGVFVGSVACSGITVHTGATYFGTANGGTFPAGEGVTVFGGGGGHFLPTAGEIATATAASLAAGKFVGVPGKTDIRWSLVDDVIEAGGKVPTYAKERVSGVDHMVVVGAPLQVAEKTDRIWSYETSPVMQGTGPLDTTSKYVAGLGGTVGEHASGLWWAAALTVTSQAALGLQHFCGKRNAAFTAGWGISSTLNNTQIAPRVVTGGGLIAGPIASIAASDVHKILLIGGVLDPIAGVLRTYHKRAEVGTGQSLSGTYIDPGSAPCMMVGGLLASLGGAAGNTVAGIRVYGLMCGRGLPNLARWQAAFDACVAHEDIIEIPGMTEHLWSWNRDARDGFNPWASGVRDRIGTDHMTTYGGVANDATFARAFGW